MTPEQLQHLTPEEREIHERAEKATRGPWLRHPTAFGGACVTSRRVGPGAYDVAFCETHENGVNNAAFIAHARADIPTLLSTIATLRQEVEQAKALIAKWPQPQRLVMRSKISKRDYTTPPEPGPDYNWQNEPWVKRTSMGAVAASLRVLALMQIDGDSEAEVEDQQVMLACNPTRLLDPVLQKLTADDIIRYRLATAIALMIDDSFAEQNIRAALESAALASQAQERGRCHRCGREVEPGNVTHDGKAWCGCPDKEPA